MQSRLGSLVESLVNIVIGYTINMLANFAIFPFFGWHISLRQNVEMGLLYTLISIARSYAIRRWFNRWLVARLSGARS